MHDHVLYSCSILELEIPGYTQVLECRQRFCNDLQPELQGGSSCLLNDIGGRGESRAKTQHDILIKSLEKVAKTQMVKMKVGRLSC
jgi:hypothetical protein